MATLVKRWIPDERPHTQNKKYKGEFDFEGTIRQIIVMPSSPETIYDIGIKDESGMVIYLKRDVQGPMATGDLGIIVFPGIKQIIIEEATRDESFSIKIVYQE